MILKKNYSVFCIAVLGLTTLLSGCSRVPWQQAAIPELDEQQYRTLFDSVSQKHQQCNKHFDAEATLSLKSSLKNETIQGYLAAITPYKAKFVVTSPLGQPVYIAIINGKDFQSINIFNQTYQSGNTEKVIDEFDLPQILKEVEIGSLIDGKINSEVALPHQIRLDSKDRGIWFSIKKMSKKEHILIDSNQEIVLQRIVENSKEDPITIDYTNYNNIDGCMQPQNITVGGFSFGAEIEMQLDDILPQPLLTSRDFQVRIPEGFSKQALKK